VKKKVKQEQVASRHCPYLDTIDRSLPFLLDINNLFSFIREGVVLFLRIILCF
jgi:hypothetical protein